MIEKKKMIGNQKEKSLKFSFIIKIIVSTLLVLLSFFVYFINRCSLILHKYLSKLRSNYKFSKWRRIQWRAKEERNFIRKNQHSSKNKNHVRSSKIKDTFGCFQFKVFSRQLETKKTKKKKEKEKKIPKYEKQVNIT